MIRIIVFRDASDRSIRRFEVSGHADFAERGKDIVCAGVSAVTVGTVNAVESVVGVELECDMHDGYLRAAVPGSVSSAAGDQVQLLLESMLVMLESIRQSYDSYIRIQQLTE